MNYLTDCRMTLHAGTATDLMTPSPISLREDASLQEALALFADRGFSAAPVINESGRPVGVLSRSDVIVHDRERVDFLPPAPEFYNRASLATNAGERQTGFQVGGVDLARVGDMMTPAVFSVRIDTSTEKVIEQLLALDVHRLFVVDRDGILVGVISAMDIVRHLRPEDF